MSKSSKNASLNNSRCTQETENQCIICQNIFEDKSLLKSFQPCNELICRDCLINTILETKLTQIKPNNKIILECPKDPKDNGKLEMTIDQLIDYLQYKELPLEKKCKKHKEKFESYCTVCKVWLCSRCKSLFHDEYFPNHELTESVPLEIELCPKHNFPKELYCKNCKCDICLNCLNKGEDHFEHDNDYLKNIEDAYNKDKGEYQYKDYKSFAKDINAKRESIKNEVNEKINEIDKSIKETIDILNTINDNYKITMKKKLELVNKSIDIILSSTKNFFHNLEEYPTPFGFRIIKNLNEKLLETKEFSWVTNNMLKDVKEKLNLSTFTNDNVKEEAENNYAKDTFNYRITLTKDEEKFCTLLNGNKTQVFSLIELNDGYLLSGEGAGENKIKMWDINNNTCITSTKKLNYNVSSIVQLKCNDKIAVAAGDHSILIFSYLGNKSPYLTLANAIKCHSDHINYLFQLDNEDRLLSCSDDKTIKISSISQNKCMWTLSGHTQPVKMAFQLNDGRIISCSKDKLIKIWDLSTLKVSMVLKGHNGDVNYLSELGGRKVVSCSDDNLIKIWDINNGNCINTLTGHTGHIYKTILLKDGRIASCSRDKTIKIWDLTRNNFSVTLTGHTDKIHDIIQLKDGRIVSAGRDTTIRIWKID